MGNWRINAALMITALGLAVVAPSASAATGDPQCNGAAELCSRTLDQVVLPGTHNSMSAAELNWALPNQSYTITHQLDMGIRAFLIDTHYGSPNPDGTVSDISKSAGRLTHAHTYLCHEYCGLGATDLTEELGRIATWLGAHPREVLTFIAQDGISPEDYATAVTNSGLLPYIYQGPVTTYPTLGQMIDSGQRVVMFAEQEAAGVPWYHEAYSGAVEETPYEFNSTPALPNGGLDDPAQLNDTCQPNRGTDPSPLFLMNHWVTTGVTPDPAKAAIVNARAAIVARAKACQTRRAGKLPNIVAVDYFGQGDLIGAVRELNGLPDPVPDPPVIVKKAILTIGKPKAVTVKSKKKATFKVLVYNTGDADSTAVKVCAKVPGGLGRNAACSTIATIPAQGTGTAVIKVTTKKRFKKGSGTVRFSAASDQGTLNTTARLTVKPLKKPKKHKRH